MASLSRASCVLILSRVSCDAAASVHWTQLLSSRGLSMFYSLSFCCNERRTALAIMGMLAQELTKVTMACKVDADRFVESWRRCCFEKCEME